MKTSIRPLTIAERKRPAQLSYHGGFKNVSFQLGEILLDSNNRNLNSDTAGYVSGFIKKSDKLQLPVRVPNAMGVLPGKINTVATVEGVKNTDGSYDAILVARMAERLSSLNTILRTVEYLIQDEDASPDPDRLGKSSTARSHNQVMLAGVVVGASFEGGPNPKFHILLRQDGNKDNVIPLTYEARNAEAMISRVRYGAIIYVDGEFISRRVPVLEKDANGAALQVNGAPVPKLDDNGEAIYRTHTYIRITAPKAPAEFDVDFGKAPPKWIIEMAKEIAARRAPKQVEPTASPMTGDTSKY